MMYFLWHTLMTFLSFVKNRHSNNFLKRTKGVVRIERLGMASELIGVAIDYDDKKGTVIFSQVDATWHCL